jgi:lipopolysaccharide transport system ATP-binding protein
VRNLCQKGLVLKKGGLTFSGAAEQAIDYYLREYSDVNRRVVYDMQNAPGNAEAKLLRVEALPLTGREWPLYEGEGLEFHFEFLYTGEDATNLDVTFHLTDEYGNLVFVGSSIFIDRIEYFDQGIITASCIIPPDFMHHGIFSLSRVYLVRNRGSVVTVCNDVISFELIPSPSENLGWMGKKEGVVKPKLSWKLEHDPGN